MDTSRDTDPVLQAVVFHWLSKIEHARQHKRRVFGEDADECRGFYNGPRDWSTLMSGREGMAQQEMLPDPTFQMKVNKAFELVTLFGPAMYYQNPVRTVNPRVPLVIPPEFFPDPNVYQAIAAQETQRTATEGLLAALVETYLGWLPLENQLVEHSRRAIVEALITGRGCLWTELKTPPGTSFKVASTYFDSVDHLQIDPDAESLETATWIARKCVHPCWQVERDYGLPVGSLKGNMESQAVQVEIAQDERSLYDRQRGLTNDLITYWKIYSKMGAGGRLSGINKRYRGPLELFGDNVYLVVARDVPYPLNLPPEVQGRRGFDVDPSAVMARVAWPTPFWPRGWPVSCIDFHPIDHCPWPTAHLRAGMGELKFLNWAMSFLAGKMRATCRDFIACKKEAAEEIKTALLDGRDLTLIEIESQYGSVSEVVQFLQHPEINGDIWKVIEAVEANFDRRVGLTELMYGAGGATQIRSAQEVSVRSATMNVRPDAMAKQVEAWMAEVALKEGICSRFHLRSADVSPVLGSVAGWAWDQYAASTDLDAVTRQLEYRVEAGSARRPNRETQVIQSQEGLVALLPVLSQYAMATGDYGPFNALVGDWAKARDLDPARYALSAPPPPPALPAPASGQAAAVNGAVPVA